MRQLRSTTAELRQLFEESITVRAVAEFDLWRADAAADGEAVRQTMAANDFDVAPVVDGPVVVGYVVRDSLLPGPCGQQIRPITPAELIAESAPLLDLFAVLRDNSWRFVLERSQVSGIVTRGDLRKAPARMYVFALINLLEMQMDRLIRTAYRNESDWRDCLRAERVEEAERVLHLRRQANEALGLVDCLQLCDKRDIALATPSIADVLEFPSRKRALTVLGRAERLRNRIAHAQDMVEGTSWHRFFDLVNALELTIRKCELATSLD